MHICGLKVRLRIRCYWTKQWPSSWNLYKCVNILLLCHLFDFCHVYTSLWWLLVWRPKVESGEQSRGMDDLTYTCSPVCWMTDSLTCLSSGEGNIQYSLFNHNWGRSFVRNETYCTYLKSSCSQLNVFENMMNENFHRGGNCVYYYLYMYTHQ